MNIKQPKKKMKKGFYFLLIIATQAILVSCEKKDEIFKTPAIADFSPLTVGKYITYRLDSTVYTSFGTRKEIHSYEVKYVTDAAITDNLGRAAYRIIRYIRNSPVAPWQSDASFMAVNTGTGLEFTENNMRFLKLKQPIKEGANWKGNSFIDTYSLYSEVKYLADWDYTYEDVDLPATVGSMNLDSTVTVNQRDEITGNPADRNSYSEVNIGKEIYARSIGLVYRKFLHTTYQPGNGGYFEEGSYGVEYTITGHN